MWGCRTPKLSAQQVPRLTELCPLPVLQDSGDRLMLDIERSRREHWKFGAKLVRGAYMYLEKARADELGYPSPVWDSLQQTHANYNRWVGCLPYLLPLSCCPAQAPCRVQPEV